VLISFGFPFLFEVTVVRWFGFSRIFFSFLSRKVTLGVDGESQEHKCLLFFETGKSLDTLFVSCHK
jgi:hypothetical protein